MIKGGKGDLLHTKLIHKFSVEIKIMRVITGYLIRNERRNGIAIIVFKVTAEFGLQTV